MAIICVFPCSWRISIGHCCCCCCCCCPCWWWRMVSNHGGGRLCSPRIYIGTVWETSVVLEIRSGAITWQALQHVFSNVWSLEILCLKDCLFLNHHEFCWITSALNWSYSVHVFNLVYFSGFLVLPGDILASTTSNNMSSHGETHCYCWPKLHARVCAGFWQRTPGQPVFFGMAGLATPSQGMCFCGSISTS